MFAAENIRADGQEINFSKKQTLAKTEGRGEQSGFAVEYLEKIVLLCYHKLSYFII